MRLTVRFFATLRDRAGTSTAQVEIEEPATVADLLSALLKRYPSLEPSIPTALVAVNQEYSLPEDSLKTGDEVALFPPVVGGA
jgi:molybdopterin converting factor subunit 1